MRMDIIPYAGLCNRMRVMASGYACARELGYSARVHWTWSLAECRAKFQDLFELPSLPELEIVETNSLLYHPDNHLNLHLPSLLRSVAFKRVVKDYNFRDAECRQSLSSHLKQQQISGDFALCSMHQCGPNYPLKELFRPRAEILREIDALVPEGSATDMVGVHIRRTDHAIAIKYASIEAYATAMQEELERNPSCRFFLATDDASVKDELARRFGKERLVTAQLVLRRDARDGMVGAVIDLFSLSRTGRIIGSFRSSYSEIAAELGNIPIRLP